MRKSPTESATLFSQGTTKKGNDGSMWKVITTSNGIKRWQRKSLQQKTVKRKSPKQKTVKRKSPKRKSPKRKSPKQKTVKRKSPKRKSPKQKTVKRKSPKQKTVKRKSQGSVSCGFTHIRPKTPMLAKEYKKQDIKGWWVSEKLDGVRSIFYNGKFYSRNNNIFRAPSWFVDKMPKGVVLDGELYTKRGDFQNVMSIVSKNVPVSEEWKQIKYVVFDIPMNCAFEDRLSEMKRIFRSTSNVYIKMIKYKRIKSTSELEEFYKNVVRKGGEGVMLREPGSHYESKRSASLIKYKKFKDKEAIVVGYEKGSGKYSGVLGKLIVKWKGHVQGSSTFKVGTGFTDAQRKNYTKLFRKGTIVKIKYFEMTSSNKPRFPVFVGVRSRKDI